MNAECKNFLIGNSSLPAKKNFHKINYQALQGFSPAFAKNCNNIKKKR